MQSWFMDNDDYPGATDYVGRERDWFDAARRSRHNDAFVLCSRIPAPRTDPSLAGPRVRWLPSQGHHDGRVVRAVRRFHEVWQLQPDIAITRRSRCA